MSEFPQCTCKTTLGIDGCLVHGPQARLLKPANKPEREEGGVAERLVTLRSLLSKNDELVKRLARYSGVMDLEAVADPHHIEALQRAKGDAGELIERLREVLDCVRGEAQRTLDDPGRPTLSRIFVRDAMHDALAELSRLQRYGEFGRLLVTHILGIGEDWWDEEWSEDVMPLAVKAGLARREPYDPEVHKFDCEADPGDEIWVWEDDVFNHRAAQQGGQEG